MIDLTELQRRITATVPVGYVRYVEVTPAEALAAQGFDPTTLLCLNLSLAHLEDTEEHRQRFFLTGDGCGNYLFINPNIDPEKVMLWAHDPMGIEDPKLQLTSYLPGAEQMDRIDLAPLPGKLYICRTQRIGESILDPIPLDDWMAAVDAADGIEHQGYREGRNPFTGEVSRFVMPGLSITQDVPERHLVHFWRGRAELDDSPLNQRVAHSLAIKLNARVLKGVAEH